MLLGLSELFRAALARPHDVALGEEWALVRRYLEIEAVRFGPRLRVAWRLPEPLPEVAVPALSVQALVENAVRHGIALSPEGGGIDIVVDVVGDEVGVEGCHTCHPGPADRVAAGHAIGLPAQAAPGEAGTGGGVVAGAAAGGGGAGAVGAGAGGERGAARDRAVARRGRDRYWRGRGGGRGGRGGAQCIAPGAG